MTDEPGTFIYRVLSQTQLRSAPSIGDEFRVKDCFFDDGDLVHVDLIRSFENVDTPTRTNGPFLRLADGSGWLFEYKAKIICLQREKVERGLWTFYGDNFPAGVGIRSNPIDYALTQTSPCVHPLQRIVCDLKVQGDDVVTFYRIQGTTHDWVFDQRKPDITMLLPENKIRTGLFAYRVVKDVGIRRIPDVGDESRTGGFLSQGEICAVDAVRLSPYNYGNGPFLHLTDCTGWLFEYKHNEKTMEEIHVQSGSWLLRVVNEKGIYLRKQPVDNSNKFKTVYPLGTEIHCDKKIETENVSFYRVLGVENGWVFDTRRGHSMLKLVVYRDTAEPGWTLDYVRRVADSAGLDEIEHQFRCRLVSFRIPGGRINVYYTTRTIGTALEHPEKRKTQLFRRNCTDTQLLEIFRNPRTHTGKGYYRKRRHSEGSFEEESVLRNELLECDEEMERLIRRRTAVLKSLREFDEIEATEGRVRIQKHALCIKAEMERKRAEAMLLQQQAEEERQRKIRQSLTCHQCQREFVNKHALNQHVQAVHVFECEECGKICKSSQAMKQHKDALGHW